MFERTLGTVLLILSVIGIFELRSRLHRRLYSEDAAGRQREQVDRIRMRQWTMIGGTIGVALGAAAAIIILALVSAQHSGSDIRWSVFLIVLIPGGAIFGALVATLLNWLRILFYF